MATKHQKLTIKIPEEYTAMERELIGQEILDLIRERSQSGKDKKGRTFPKYSESYVKSLDFKIAGKKKGQVNLTLSGDMLGAMDLLAHKKGQLTVGFEAGTPENARADGNIRGTYGQPKAVGPKRDFLGLTKKELEAILAKYPVEDKSAREDAMIGFEMGRRSSGRSKVSDRNDE